MHSTVSTWLPEERIVPLYGEITDETSSGVTHALLVFAAQHPTRPITMLISSPGGSVYDTLAIYDVMQTVGPPIYTVGFGPVFSGAAVLLMAGDRGHRFLYPHTSVMLHKIQAMIPESQPMDNFVRTLSETRNLHNWLLHIVSKHTGKSIKRLEKDLSNDFYLTPSEAIKYGVADHIIQGPVKLLR